MPLIEKVPAADDGCVPPQPNPICAKALQFNQRQTKKGQVPGFVILPKVNDLARRFKPPRTQRAFGTAYYQSNQMAGLDPRRSFDFDRWNDRDAGKAAIVDVTLFGLRNQCYSESRARLIRLR